MSIHISPNDYNIDAVEATRNPGNHEIINLQIREEHDGSIDGVHIILLQGTWQQVADALASLGIVGKVAEVSA